jgi:hypothetical protein
VLPVIEDRAAAAGRTRSAPAWLTIGFGADPVNMTDARFDDAMSDLKT